MSDDIQGSVAGGHKGSVEAFRGINLKLHHVQGISHFGEQVQEVIPVFNGFDIHGDSIARKGN